MSNPFSVAAKVCTSRRGICWLTVLPLCSFTAVAAVDTAPCGDDERLPDDEGTEVVVVGASTERCAVRASDALLCQGLSAAWGPGGESGNVVSNFTEKVGYEIPRPVLTMTKTGCHAS